MEVLYVLLGFFLYFLIGTIWSGIATRILKDDFLLPATLIGWPATIPLGILVFIYACITGQKISDIL